MIELSSLSPSRANDFRQCPLKYRFRTVDKLPEPPSSAALKGTLVHSVLEHLFDSPAAERTEETAAGLLPSAWQALLDKDSEYAELFADPGELAAWLKSAEGLVRAYFGLEYPQNLEPESREQFLSVPLEDGPKLRGFIDRIDVAPGGQIRVVDYKSGKQPRPQYSGEADFQMRFYALMISRLRGTLPHTLQLIYLGSSSIVRYHPTPEDLERTEFQIREIWAEIAAAAETGRWRPKKSPLCNWCHFKPLCPAWGNTAPDAPEVTVQSA